MSLAGSLALSVSAAAAASYAGFACVWPSSHLYGRVLTVGPDPNCVYLTFDDGPNDRHTLEILDLLDIHGAKATFFVLGKFVRQRGHLVREMVGRGHTVGNHTDSHPNLIFCSIKRIKTELYSCSASIEDAVGTRCSLFRPPFGWRTPAVLRAAAEMGMQSVLWRLSARDCEEFDPTDRARQLIRQVAGGDILLFHDGSHEALGRNRSRSVQTIAMLLPALRTLKIKAL